MVKHNTYKKSISIQNQKNEKTRENITLRRHHILKKKCIDNRLKVLFID